MSIFSKLATATAVPVAYAFAHGYGWHMMDEHYGFYNLGGVIMFIVLILLVAVGVYLLLRNKHWVRTSACEAPLEILKKSYAKGALTKKEFQRMKKELK
jgi:putative membrane protein